MATTPKKKTLKKDSVSILNAVRNNMSPEYRASVPEAYGIGATVGGQTLTAQDSTMSIKAVGNAIMQNEGFQNEFLSYLMNRIGLTIISSKSYDNPWARLKRGMLEFGEYIEDIFVDIMSPHVYDPVIAETQVEKREIPNVKAYLKSINSQVFYKQSVQPESIRKAFLSPTGIYDLIMKIAEAMYTAMNYDEFLAMKYVICQRALNGTMYNETLTSNGTSEDIVTKVKEVSNYLRFASRKYNYAGVLNHASPDEQYVFISSKLSAQVDVQVLAKAFNLSYAEFSGQYILTDTFTFTSEEIERLNVIFEYDNAYEPITPAQNQALANIDLMLVDKDFFMVWDYILEMKDRLNEQGLYRNQWLHIWKIYGTSLFANAILFTDSAQTVTSVSVTPAQASTSPNTELQMKASVTGSPFVDKGVHWEISGTGSDATITQSGFVTFGADANGEYTVTVTSIADPEKSETSTITVA